jgi:TonB-linked SusC/RagA family outer membrane protein
MRSKFKWIFTLLVALTMQLSFAQEKTVKGIVTDASGPMPGVNVVVKGTQRGVSTGFDGSYSIKASQGEVLVFSFMGMNDILRTVDASSTVNVKMQDNTQQLGEVVVTGSLGIKRKGDAVVSAQKQINNKELTQAANPNAIQALTGKVSGLQINTASNGVSASTRIVLRGTRSITGNNQALVVIDNAISSADVLSQLPPDVIESVNVIKGAQGGALYGEQGVNGVILVTTKKGSKREKMTVVLSSAVDFEDVLFVPNRQTQYGQGWNTDPGFSGPGTVPTFVPFENGSWGPAFSNTSMGPLVPVGLPQADGNFLFTEWKPIKDNIKQFFQTGTILQNGVSVNMGSEDAYALLSVNHQGTDFVVDGDVLKRNSFLFKGGKKFGKFSLDANFNYISQSTSQTSPDLFDDLIQTATNIPVSRFANSGNEGHWTVYAQNPYWLSKAVRFDDKSNVANAIVNLGYEFNKHVNVTYNANVRLTSTDGQQHTDKFDNTDPKYTYNFGDYDYYGSTSETYQSLGGQPVVSSFFANQSFARNFYGDLLFNFNYDLTSKLNLKFNIGNNLQDNTSRVTTQGGSNLNIPGFYHITNVLNPARPATLANRLTNSRRASFFVNADLAYEDYLFLNATFRRDQSSVIKKAFYYPSVGLSFIPTKFFAGLKDKNGLNYMKLNASYTSVGNSSSVGAYATTDLAAISAGFPFGNLASYQYNVNQTNSDIKPEYVNTFEVGGQFGFFKDRVTLEGSYYIANTKDLITNSTTSTTSGQSSFLNNIGDLENKGYEIDLGLTPIKTKSFKWDLKGSYSTYKVVVKSLQDGLTSINLQSNGVVGVFAEVGEEFPLIKGTTFVKDANGNYIVDTDFGNLPKRSSELTKLGKANPDYIIGLTNSFEYKGIRLTAVADYRTGGSTYSFAKNTLLFTGGDLDTAGFDRDLGYTLPGPAVDQNGNPYTGPVSTPDYAGTLTYFTETHRAVAETNMIDTSALKIRELSLSYALPTKIVEKMGVEAFRFGVNARNPFVFLADGKLLKPKNGLHANNGYSDPEASNTTGNAQGITDIGQYPSTRTIGFSVNVTF